MINRRTFGALLAGAVAAPRSAWSRSVTAKTVYYAGVGPELSLYDIDVAEAALQKRSTVTLPANVQYAWPHPSKRYLYVVSSSGGPGVAGDKHVANAFRVDPASGALTPHGEPQMLPSRPVHCSVDRSGDYLLDRLQRSEQRHRASHQGRRHARRSSEPAGQSRHRRLRASGADDAGQPDRDLRRRAATTPPPASPRTPARSRFSVSRTAR